MSQCSCGGTSWEEAGGGSEGDRVMEPEPGTRREGGKWRRPLDLFAKRYMSLVLTLNMGLTGRKNSFGSQCLLSRKCCAHGTPCQLQLQLPVQQCLN